MYIFCNVLMKWSFLKNKKVNNTFIWENNIVRTQKLYLVYNYRKLVLKKEIFGCSEWGGPWDDFGLRTDLRVFSSSSTTRAAIRWTYIRVTTRLACIYNFNFQSYCLNFKVWTNKLFCWFIRNIWQVFRN